MSVVRPEVTAAPVVRYVDNAMVKAIARGFRWRDMLESGEYATIRKIAAAETINEIYVGRVLRLAPDIVEAVLNGQQSGRIAVGRPDEAVSGGMGGSIRGL